MARIQKKTAPKTLVFLDIDGTLLKPNYRANSTAVPKLLVKLEKKGYIFCLNSNRAMHDLLPVAKQFGIRGPIVIENGVMARIDGKVVSLDTRVRPIARKLDAALAEIAKKKGLRFFKIDTVKDGRNTKYTKGAVLLVNKFRTYTASIHVRSGGRKDLDLAKRLAPLFRNVFGSGYEVFVSNIFANILVSPTSVDKGRAVQKLKQRYPRAKVVMVGDDAGDVSASKVVDRFYVVGNAEPALKKLADYTAEKKYTQGVVEILRHIDAIVLS
jgi:HAD superfamily hydrolase (TIGR01484 family)